MNIKKIYDGVTRINIFVISVLVIVLLPISIHAVTNDIETWWPVEGSHLGGIQSIKGLQKGYAVEQYAMYWQVDGGALVPMNTSYDGYAHKRAIVDFSSWNWKGTGPYRLTFKTENASGTTISETSINIYTDSNVKLPTPEVPVVVNDLKKINVWWPTESVQVSGLFPLKALVEGEKIEDYSLTWQVDGGIEKTLENNYTDYPHKESPVDASNWNKEGPYVIALAARSNGTGLVIAKDTRSIYVNKEYLNKDVVPSVSNLSNSLIGKKLYVDTNSPAAQQALQWSSTRPRDVALLQKIADKPTAIWLGSWSSDAVTREKISNTMSSAQTSGSIPTFVLYNIPSRDCGSYSAGGANDPSGYASWIHMVSNALGKSPSIVILEPDALSQMDCLSSVRQDERMKLLRDAITTLKTNTGAYVYLDAGHGGWLPVSTMSDRLKKAGIFQADGFSLNVSNFHSTTASVAFGKEVSSQTGNKYFVIDTSRNGLGSNGEWCNPSGRALGQQPTTHTGEALVDAYLWIKVPGESDGTCNGGPSAGTWWSEYALGLSSRSSW